MSVYQEKVQQVAGLLNEFGLDMWLIFVRETAESTDPVLKVLGHLNAVWPAAFMFHRSGARIAITGMGDDEAVRSQGLFDEVIPYQLSVKEPLLDVITKWNPASIGLNYSQSDVAADGLSYGMLLNLQTYLADTPYAERLVSAEEVCEAVRSRKTAAELDAMHTAAVTALGIFDGMAGWLRSGMSEKAIAARVQQQVADLGLENSWDDAHCPGLNAGPDSPWGHAGASDEVIRPGITLNMDFGVKQDGFCSDNQRVWYFLREGETAAPAGVQARLQFSARRHSGGVRRRQAGHAGLGSRRRGAAVYRERGLPRVSSCAGPSGGPLCPRRRGGLLPALGALWQQTLRPRGRRAGVHPRVWRAHRVGLYQHRRDDRAA